MYRFVTNCIGSTYEAIRALIDSQVETSLPAFRKAIGPEQWAWIQKELGYDRHLPISKDWHVRFYRGLYLGKPSVFVRHSGIEYIFVKS